MAKRGRPKKVGRIVKKRGRPPLTKPNGQEALAQTEREMPTDGEQAIAALRTLADLNDQVKACETAEADAKARHKETVDALKEANKTLSDRLWALTHKPNLPLFNEQEAEADVARIQDAADTGAVTTEGVSVLEGASEAPSVPPLALPDAEATETASAAVDPSEPF